MFNCERCGYICHNYQSQNSHVRWCRSTRITNLEPIDPIGIHMNVADRGDDSDGAISINFDPADNTWEDIKDVSDSTFTDFATKLEEYENTLALEASRSLNFTDQLDFYGEFNACSISDKEGQHLVKTFTKIFRRRGIVVQYLPKNWVNVRRKIEKPFQNVFHMTSFNYKTPKAFACPRKIAYTGHYLNGMEVLQSLCMNFNLDDIYIAPSHNFSATEGHIYGHPCSSDAYDHLSNYTKEAFGEDVVPIIIIIGLDDVALNKVGSRGTKPLYMKLGNVKEDRYWDAQSIECFGMAPKLQVVNYFNIYLFLKCIFIYTLILTTCL